MVEALITDCNGIARGKWLPVQKLDTIEKQGSSSLSQRWGSTCGVVIFRAGSRQWRYRRILPLVEGRFGHC